MFFFLSESKLYIPHKMFSFCMLNKFIHNCQVMLRKVMSSFKIEVSAKLKVKITTRWRSLSALNKKWHIMHLYYLKAKSDSAFVSCISVLSSFFLFYWILFYCVYAAETQPGSVKVGRLVSKRMLQTTGDWRSRSLSCLWSLLFCSSPRPCALLFQPFVSDCYWHLCPNPDLWPLLTHVDMYAALNSWKNEWPSMPDGKFPKFMGFI